MIAVFVVPQEKPKKKYIDLDVAINAVYEAYANGESAYDALESIPPADVRPVKRGKWKPRDLTWGRSYYYCSACEETVDMPTAMGIPMFRYCPNCGAWMEGTE